MNEGAQAATFWSWIQPRSTTSGCAGSALWNGAGAAATCVAASSTHGTHNAIRFMAHLLGRWRTPEATAPRRRGQGKSVQGVRPIAVAATAGRLTNALRTATAGTARRT